MRRALLLLAVGCGGGEPQVPTGTPPEHLSALGLFTYQGDGVFDYAEGVVPYDVNTELFSDHSLKDRALWIPEGAAAYHDDDAFAFPVGTVLIKSFSFAPDLRDPDADRRLVETRLLIHQEDGWQAWPYVWNEAETEATLTVGGRVLPISLVDADGEPLSFPYLVPQRNQCAMCHEIKGDDGETHLTPIGTKARYLARARVVDGQAVDQLAHLADLGRLTGLPDEVPAAFDFREVEARGVADLDPAEVERAARDWLDVNCAHCHSPRGVTGLSSQLFLNHDNDDAFRLGVCKRPGSAGGGGADRTYDIVPGDHEASILWYRMTTTEVGAMMPDIGRATTPWTASDLVARWIDEMEGSCDDP